MDFSTNNKATPYVDDIYKERNKLNQKRIDIQNSIKDIIYQTDTQIRKLKNKIDVLNNKKKTLIIEYNKECDIEDRIRGNTPPKTLTLNPTNSFNKIIPLSPNSEIINNQNKEIANIKKELEGNKFKKLIETMMENNLSSIKQYTNKEITKRVNKSCICDIM